MRATPWLAGAALLAVAGWIWSDTAGWIAQGWAENPYYSHGPLVPLLTIALLYRLRHALATAPWRTYAPGYGLVVAAALLNLSGRLVDINFLVATSIPLTILGVVLAAGGPEVSRLTFLPLAFLFFAVPLSQLLIHHFGFPLQLASAKLAALMMSLTTGAQSSSDGAVMWMDGERYLVAAECSGFKALLGLSMVGVLMAYLTDTSLSRRLLIALAAVPLAVCANIFRLYLILVAGRLISHDFAVTVFHDWSGLVMLGIEIALLLAVARAIVGPGAEVAAAPAPAGSGERRFRVEAAPLLVAAVLLAVCGGLGRRLAPPPPPAPEVDLARVPKDIGPWQGEDLPIDPRVHEELGDVAIIQREYRHADGLPPVQMLVICGRGRRSLHPPAACYIGSGREVLGEEQCAVSIGREELRFERLTIGDDGRARLMALYTFTDGQTTTPDYALHQRQALSSGRTIWTQLHVGTAWQGSAEETERLLVEFIADAWPAVRDELPR